MAILMASWQSGSDRRNSGAFDPVMYGAALSNMQFATAQISEVIVPQWIGQAKAHYQLPYKFDAGLTFYYGSYRDLESKPERRAANF